MPAAKAVDGGSHIRTAVDVTTHTAAGDPTQLINDGALLVMLLGTLNPEQSLPSLQRPDAVP